MVRFAVALFSDDEFEKILRYGEQGSEDTDKEVDSWELSDACDMYENVAYVYFKLRCRDFEKKPPTSAINVVIISADTDLGSWSVAKRRRFECKKGCQ